MYVCYAFSSQVLLIVLFQINYMISSRHGQRLPPYLHPTDRFLKSTISTRCSKNTPNCSNTHMGSCVVCFYCYLENDNVILQQRETVVIFNELFVFVLRGPSHWLRREALGSQCEPLHLENCCPILLLPPLPSAHSNAKKIQPRLVYFQIPHHPLYVLLLKFLHY